jgi:hypothetical protein
MASNKVVYCVTNPVIPNSHCCATDSVIADFVQRHKKYGIVTRAIAYGGRLDSEPPASPDEDTVEERRQKRQKMAPGKTKGNKGKGKARDTDTRPVDQLFCMQCKRRKVESLVSSTHGATAAGTEAVCSCARFPADN